MDHPRRFCTNCGAEIFNPQQVYCLNCGAQLISAPGEVKSYNLITAWLSFFKRYADFKGRSRRQEYWLAYLANFIIGMALNFIRSATMVAARTSYDYSFRETAESINDFFFMVTVLYMLATVIPNLAIQTRRLHDTGRSGKLLLLWLVPSALGFFFVGIPAIAALISMPFNVGYYDAQQGMAAYSMLFMVVGVILTAILTLVLEIMFLVFYCQEGQREENQYGRSPK